jgi:hypothetical protein
MSAPKPLTAPKPSTPAKPTAPKPVNPGDDDKAQKIADRLGGQMDLNANTLGAKVNQSLGMVGKGPADADAMTDLVKGKLVAMGKMQADVDEDARVQSTSFLDSDAFYDVGEKLADSLGLTTGWVNVLQNRLHQRGMETREMNRTSASFSPQKWEQIKSEFAKYFNIDVEANHTFTITLKA